LEIGLPSNRVVFSLLALWPFLQRSGGLVLALNSGRASKKFLLGFRKLSLPPRARNDLLSGGPGTTRTTSHYLVREVGDAGGRQTLPHAPTSPTAAVAEAGPIGAGG